MIKKNCIWLVFILVFFNKNMVAQTQSEMNKIANKDFQSADIKLNRVYKECNH